MKLSIIIPTLHEEKLIEHTLSTLKQLGEDIEIIVVDGKSKDATVALASRYTRVITTSRGRGRQLNAGVEATRGDILLFLHADTLPDPGGIQELLDVMRESSVVGGAFRMRFDSTEPLYQRIAANVTRRSLRTKSYTGDQAIFTRRTIFQHLHGHRLWPFMEDVDYSERMNKIGKVVLLHHEVETSARRHRQWGLFRTQITVVLIRLLYLLKVSPTCYAWLWPEVR